MENQFLDIFWAKIGKSWVVTPKFQGFFTFEPKHDQNWSLGYQFESYRLASISKAPEALEI